TRHSTAIKRAAGIATLTTTLLVLAAPAPSSPHGRRGVTQLVSVRWSVAGALAISKDGKVVAAGGWRDRTERTGGFALARYMRTGRLDTNFGTGGKVLTSFGTRYRAEGVVTQPDGKIVAAGSSDRPAHLPGERFALARYRSHGGLDAGFGNGGMVLTSFGRQSGAADIALQRDGKLVVVGWSGKDDGHLALARYLRNGRL